MDLEKELREMKILIPTISNEMLVETYDSVLKDYERLMPTFGVDNKDILLAYLDLLFTLKEEKKKRGIMNKS